jgi:RecA-family ATPase
MSDVKTEDVQPLWPLRFYRGKLNLLAGHPGLGKSYVSHWLAARVSVGGEVPFGDGERFPQGDVLLFAAEDGPGDTIKPRLVRCGADLSRIHVVEAVIEYDSKQQKIDRLAQLDRDIQQIKSLLSSRADSGRPIIAMVFDTIDSYLGKTDSHKSAEVRGVLGPLVALAAEFNICVIAISHLSKGGQGPAITRSLGSIAFVGLSRSAWLVTTDPDDPAAETGTSSRRLLLQVKNNLAPTQRGLVFHINERGIEWTEESSVTADRALAPVHKKKESSKLHAACDWLSTRLAGGEAHESKLVMDEAKALGFARNMIFDARKAMDVKPFPDDGKWFIRLVPKSNATENGTVGTDETLGILGTVKPLGPIDDQYIEHTV